MAGSLGFIEADKAEVVLVVQLLAEVVIDVLHDPISEEEAVELRVNDEDDGASLNVVVAQPLVNGLAIAPDCWRECAAPPEILIRIGLHF